MSATMSIPSLFLFWFLLTIFISDGAVTSFRCHSKDYNAVMQIKKSFNNPKCLASWEPNTDCCKWNHIRCGGKSHRVHELQIEFCNISGVISPFLGNLSSLRSLMFIDFNIVNGEIPASITNLKNLEYLVLNRLNLKGPIPTFLIQLSKLYYLDLSSNQFTGSIPPIFSTFTKLQGLVLTNNKLTGTIPASFGHFVGFVPNLHLSYNQLTGSIPKSFANMDFEIVELIGNKLVGDASMLFKPNGSTYALDLGRNMFEFDFSKVRIPKTLGWLDMNHNNIYGSVPKDLAMLKDLKVFNVSNNKLCGEIPTGGQMSKFNSSSYIGNRCLCGSPLPQCVI